MYESEVKTGTGGRASLFTKRNFVIVCLLLAVILVIAVIVYFVRRPKNNVTVQSALNSSAEAFDKGDYTGALAALQGATSQAMTKEQKILVYENMAASAASSGKLQEALDYYGLKHKLDPNTANKDAYSMAQIYLRLNDRQKAIEQYKIAIEYYKSQKTTASGSNNDLATMEAQLRELEAGQ